MFERGNIYIAPNLNVSDYILEDREDELIAAIAEASETDPTITVAKPEDFRSEFLEGLKHDAKILKELVARMGKRSQSIPNSMNFCLASTIRTARPQA